MRVSSAEIGIGEIGIGEKLDEENLKKQTVF
jgi:hypothetical protein